MGDPLSGGIKAEGIHPQAEFKKAAIGTPAPVKPYMTFPVKPEAVNEIISNLNKLKGRTDNSEILQEKTSTGETKYSFIDTRNNQPLAVMTAQSGQTTLSLYKSPEEMAKRIDSVFVKPDSIREFVANSRADIPAESYAFKP